MSDIMTRAHAALGTAALTDVSTVVYTVPACSGGYAVTSSLCPVVANVAGSAAVQVDVAIDITGSGTLRYLAKAMTIPAGATLVLPSVTVVAGDKLRARASAASSADLYVSVVERV